MRFRTLLVPFAVVALVASARPARAAMPAFQSPAVDSVVVSVPSATLVMPDIVQATATVWPATESQSVTWSSSDPAVAIVNPEGTLQPQRQGSVTLTATSAADPTKSGSVTLTVVCPAPITVSRNVDGDTTWDNWIPDIDCYDYVVTTVVAMNDETLTIEPGTRVGFGEGEWLRVLGDGAALVAVGTAADPIVLAAKNDLWMGLRFFDGFGTLDQVSIVDGGRESFGANVRAAVTVVSPRGNEPPESRVEFGSAVTLAGTDYEIAFGDGDTYATGCVGRVFVQGGGARGDHCR